MADGRPRTIARSVRDRRLPGRWRGRAAPRPDDADHSWADPPSALTAPPRRLHSSPSPNPRSWARTILAFPPWINRPMTTHALTGNQMATVQFCHGVSWRPRMRRDVPTLGLREGRGRGGNEG